MISSPLLRKLFTNGAWGVIGTGVGRVLNLLAMVLLARTLGLVQFGYFGLVQSTLGMLGVFAGTSIGSTGTRFVAELKETDPDRAGRILGMVWFVSAVLSFIIVAGLFAFAGDVALSLQTSDGTNLESAIMVGGVLVAANSMRSVQSAVLGGFERFKEIALLKLFEGFLVLVFMPWFGAMYGVVGALSGMAFAASVVLIIGVPLTAIQLKLWAINIDWRGLRSEFQVLISYSLPSLLSNLMGTPVIWFGVMLLSRQPDGIEGTALYNAAYQWHGPLIFVPMILNTVGMPILVQLWTSNDHKRFLRLLLLLGCGAVILAGAPGAVVTILRERIMFAYGEDFLAGQTILFLLVAAAPFHVLANIGMTALQSINRAWLILATVFVWAAVFILLSWCLIPKFGALGMASSLLSAYIILALLRIILVFIISTRMRKPL